ncbi:hypothetical protein ABFS83_08G228800 [Erythranthe nasuta]
MEERVPPSDKPPLPPPPTTASSLETYVVQIPRDQIYRVPPPEHALIVETHKRNSSDQQKTCRRPICWILFPVFLLFAVVFAAVMIARATLYTPVPPEFTVTRVMGRNLAPPPKGGGGGSHRQPEFDVTLRAKNPNARMSVSYLAGGQASLVFKSKKIGKGAAVRSAVRQEPGGGDVDFPVVLAGNGAALTAEIEKSLDGAAEKSMVLQIQAAAEMNSWARNERRDLKINCELKVKNSFMNKTKISFQDCRTEF